ncbi:MAG: hypothetical protein H6Q60_527 [Oscillospiraceae bacterium]|nr:hypothetical protein [Oscillospiraceae bacterium]
MNRCEQMQEYISAALDGALTGEEQQQLDDHLAECPDCARLYQELAAMGELFREPAENPPDDLLERVMEEIHHDAEKQSPAAAHRRRLRALWLAGAAVFAVVLIGYGGAQLLMDGLGRSGASTADTMMMEDASGSSVTATQGSDEEVQSAMGPQTGEAEITDSAVPSFKTARSQGTRADAADGADSDISGEDTADESAGEDLAETTEDAAASAGTPDAGSMGEATASSQDEAPEQTEESFGMLMQSAGETDAGEADEETWYAKMELTGTIPELLSGYEYTQEGTQRYYTVPAGEFDLLEDELTALGYRVTVTREGDGIDASAENALIVVTEN